MLMNTSFIISKEEFAFCFPLPVKDFPASCLTKEHGLEPEIWDHINSRSGNFKKISLVQLQFLSTFLVLPVSIEPPCPACPAASPCTLQAREGSFWSPDTSVLFGSSCRAESMSLGRRHHRKAEAEGVNRPCSWYFTWKTALAEHWDETSSLWKGCSALEPCEACFTEPAFLQTQWTAGAKSGPWTSSSGSTWNLQKCTFSGSALDLLEQNFQERAQQSVQRAPRGFWWTLNLRSTDV